MVTSDIFRALYDLFYPSLPTAYCYKFSTLSGPIVHIHPELIGEPTMYYGLRVRKRDQADAGMFFCQS